MRHLIDSNPIIEYLNGTLPSLGKAFFRNLLEEGNAFVSDVTRIEVLGYPRMAPGDRQQALHVFSRLASIPMEEEIVELTIHLRSSVGGQTADAIIAATAIQYELPLITRNLEDFKRFLPFHLAIIDLHQM